MGWIGRHRSARVFLRALFVLASCELTLTAGAWALERLSGASGAEGEGDGAIVCVGDSNTFGIGAPSGRSYPDQLRELLRRAGEGRAVVNLGLPGLDSGQIVDRLVRRIGGARPACVVFLGGYNDWARADVLVDARDEGRSADRAPRFLRWSRTYRVAVAAIRIARGDVEHAESGGQEREDLPEPRSVPYERWDAEYERAKRRSFSDQSHWIRFFWTCEDSRRMDVTLADLRARPDFAAVESSLRLPFDAYVWDADVVAGRAVRPLNVPAGAPLVARQFAEYTRVWCTLAEGRTALVRAVLPRRSPLGDDPWALQFRDLLLAWTDLLDRDFARAGAELGTVADRATLVSPEVGLHVALGGGALATLLGDDAARLAGFIAHHPAWKEEYFPKEGGTRQEWMAAANWTDAVKSGDAAAIRAAQSEIAATFGGRAVTRPLAWLFAHPDADFARIRAELPLEPPRTSWIGTSYRVFRDVGEAEFGRVVRPALDRLGELAGERGFPVVVLTYLNYEAQMQNRCLREAAAERSWTLVDMERLHPRAELGADDKRRYFCPDRGHPNEAGYALVAAGVFDALRSLGLVAGR